jgi:hypothetical protein
VTGAFLSNAGSRSIRRGDKPDGSHDPSPHPANIHRVQLVAGRVGVEIASRRQDATGRAGLKPFSLHDCVREPDFSGSTPSLPAIFAIGGKDDSVRKRRGGLVRQ